MAVMIEIADFPRKMIVKIFAHYPAGGESIADAGIRGGSGAENGPIAVHAVAKGSAEFPHLRETGWDHAKRRQEFPTHIQG